MQTLRLSASEELVRRAAGILRAGGLVAFPTETVYGLGANALDAGAVGKIFAAKGRPAWDPLIVHVSSREMLEGLVERVPAQFDTLFAKFMPGPLTLVFLKNRAVPDVVSAGRETVAVRFPAHRVARGLIAASRLPIAAPSANLFGHVSPTTAEHVLADLDGRIDAIVDGGSCEIGLESTVLDLSGEAPVILRQGAVTAGQLGEALGEVRVADSAARVRPRRGLKSPGMMPRHYAPRTKLLLTEGREEAFADALRERGQERLGALVPRGWKIRATAQFDWGSWGDWAELAARLYAGLRWLDAQKLDLIVAPLPSAEGLGGAIRERLLKASGGAMLSGFGGRDG